MNLACMSKVTGNVKDTEGWTDKKYAHNLSEDKKTYL